MFNVKTILAWDYPYVNKNLIAMTQEKIRPAVLTFLIEWAFVRFDIFCSLPLAGTDYFKHFRT
jgi:hypothetical protein